MRDVAGDEIARGANNLNGIELNMDRLLHSRPPDRMARDVEMVGPSRPVPERVGPAYVPNVVPHERLDPANAYSLVVPQAGDGEGEEEEVRLRRVVREEVAIEEGFLEVALACVVPTWL